MIKSGVDLIEVERIKTALQRERFRKRVYGPHEYAELERRQWNAESAAAWFCAKEAFGKAMGTGIRGFSLCEVEVLHDELGCPFLLLSGRAKALAEEKHCVFSISLTHTKEYAAAFVTAESTPPPPTGVTREGMDCHADFYCAADSGN